jgi:kynurenine formamidase
MSNDTPTYMDNPPVTIEQVSSMESGGIANWFSLTTINHNGTHVEAPWHFVNDGRRLDELDPADFVFASPVIIDVTKGRDDLITREDLEAHSRAIEGSDVLMVRTGFAARFRDHEPETYGKAGPGFSESAGHYLREFPKLRCLMMDIISAGAPAHPEEGVEFHRAALGGTDGNAANAFVLVVEDCRLDADLTAEDLALVVLTPIRMRPSDAGLCGAVGLSRKDLAGLGFRHVQEA